MHPAGFEPAISASGRPPTHALDRAVTAIGHVIQQAIKNLTAGTRPGFGLHGKGMAIQFLTGTRDFLFCRAHLALSSQVKRPRRISDRSPPYTAEI